MAAVREATDHAIGVANSRQPSAEVALEELRGYERFLHNAGTHLLLLATVSDLRSDATFQLAARIRHLGFRPATAGAWYDASTRFGAAHDLISTHLIDGAPRTVEGKQILFGPGPAAACRATTELIIDAVDAGRELIHRARLAQRERIDRPVTKTMLRRFRTTNADVSLHARAAMWDLTTAPANLPIGLRELEVALAPQLAARPTGISNPLVALKLLAQLCHDQAHELTSASPASLRDLALLGVRTNDPTLLEDIDDDRPLAQLQRAHAADQIDAARSAWADASTELTTTIHGITKAPGTYGAAIHTLLSHELDPRTRGAVAITLPSLGRDAARVAESLATHGHLVTLQQIPLQPRSAWRPITPDHSAALVARFTAAADASTLVRVALRDFGTGPTLANARSGGLSRQRTVRLADAHGLSR